MELGPLQKQWIEYLKNHPEEKGRGRLGSKYPDGEGGVEIHTCCLGAAGLHILKSCVWNDSWLYEFINNDPALLSQSYKLIGLHALNGEIKYPYEYPWMGNEPNALISMNDAQGNDEYTWFEIACIMEAVPEMFFAYPM